MPPTIRYGQIVSPQVEFADVGVDALSGWVQLPAEIKKVLLDGHSLEFHLGDGIVPTLSQQMHLIPGFPAAQVLELRLSNPVRHTSETYESAAITSMLQRMAE